MLSQSLTMHFLQAVKKFFSGYRQSVIYTLLMKMVACVKNSFSQSLLRGYVTAEKGLHSYYASSLLYGFLQAVFAFILRITASVSSVIAKLADGGLLHRLFAYVTSKKYG